MNITFLHQSAQYTLLSLTCKDSFQVTLNSIGASIRSIGYTDSAEKFKNIALSFASDSDYTGNTLYAGATLGPCAGRISNGWLSLPAKKYHLTRNEKNRHCLHSCIHSVSFINWTLFLSGKKILVRKRSFNVHFRTAVTVFREIGLFLFLTC